jgi:WD40 repeat protein/DNA-binding SARP family transcriptional activator
VRRLDVMLLGTFSVELDGEPVTQFGYDKVRALLAYLAIEGRRPQRRDTLVGLLWPEQPQREALANLRSALHRLRRVLHDQDVDPPFLLATHETIQLHPEAEVAVDAARFADLAALRRAHAHVAAVDGPECARALTEAVALYRGEFLPGFALDSEPFEAWLVLQREALHALALELLERLAAQAEAQGAYDQVLVHARRQLQLEPWNECAHRQAMRALTLTGHRAAALAQYQACCETLSRELGMEPEPDTLELYEQLRTGTLLRTPAAARRVRTGESVGPCPYRGLSAFDETDAALFFGRHTFVDRLMAAVAVPPGVVAVVGASGSGKSSAVLAGLLPVLRASGEWVIAVLRPGRQPFHALAGALLPLLEPSHDEIEQLVRVRRLAELLAQGALPLHDVLARLRARHGGGARLPAQPQVLLLVDQFEELYTLCTDATLQHRFVEALLDTVAWGAEPLTLLLTLRADFMGQALAHRCFADTLQRAVQLLGPMTRAELREAIEKPAAAQGAVFEAGLVERLLADVGEEPGHLPLLQFALTLLWEHLDAGWLTHAAYDAQGRVQGALAGYAQEVYDRLGLEQQALARHVFMQLIQPGEGTEDTRRVAQRAHLGEAGWALAQHLADQRLVVTGREALTGVETVELAHEALIHHWEQVQAWLAEERTFRTWQERLRVGVRSWEATGRDEGALLRGVPLAEAEEWLAARGAELSAVERAFIEAGMMLRGARRAAEADAARRLAAAHDQALREREGALRQAAIGLAAEARTLLQGPDQDLAVLVALSSVTAYPYTWQAERALAEVVLNTRLVWQFEHGVPVVSPAQVSPDGTRFLAAVNDGMLCVWDLRSRDLLLAVQAYSGVEANYHRAIWSPGSDRILTSTWQAYPRVWDARTGEQVLELPARSGSVALWSPDGREVFTWGPARAGVTVFDAWTGAVAYVLPEDVAFVTPSPDGRWLATPRGEIRDARTGALNRTLVGYEALAADHPWAFYAWSRDGTQIGTGMAGTARVWDAATGEAVLALDTGYRDMADLWWSPDGTWLLTTGYTGEASPALLWDARTGAKLHTLAAYGEVRGVFEDPWSAAGDRVLLHDEHQVTVWDARTGREVLRLAVTAEGTGAVWLPDGSGFITTDGAGGAGMTRIWRIATPEFRLSCEPDCPADNWEGWDVPAWSPEGTRLARPYDDGSVRVWDVVARAEMLRFRRDTQHAWKALNLVAWSPDATRLLLACGDGGVEIRDSISGECLLQLAGHNHIVVGVAWSPDGRRVLSCARDRRAVVWDAATGAVVREFTGQEFVWGAWSPDGQRVVLIGLHGYGGPAKVWDVERGQACLTLLPDDFGHGTSGVAWSPDGTRIVTFSLDHTGRMWDATTGARVGTFPTGPRMAVGWSPSGERILAGRSPDIGVWDVATLQQVATYPTGESYANACWSPDGKWVAVGNPSGEIRVYPAWQSLEELVAYAKAHCVLRELTLEERARYGLPER